MRRNARPLLVVLVVIALGCGGPSATARYGGYDGPPPVVTDATYHEVERVYWRMDADDPARLTWRDALMAHLGQRSGPIMERGDYDKAVEHLASLAELLRPEDIGDRQVPAFIAPLARWVIEHGGPRGDEGRVMGAMLLLTALGEDVEELRAERERIAEWGRRARALIDNPIDRYGELIQVWEQHEQVAPGPTVLDTLAQLYVEQRDALVGAFGPEGQGSRTPSQLSFQQLRLAPLLVQRAPLDVAAVYLRHGDLESAIQHVQRMGDRSGVEERLVELLEQAREDNDQGARSLAELAQGFVRARPSIGRAICRLGARRFPRDARFPLCLARVAIEKEEPGAATASYADAVRLAPDDRETYDEALGRLDQMMEAGLFETEVAQSRSMARNALSILEQRQERWPNSQAAVTREEILLQLGRAEMSAGHVDEAREALTQSLAIRESREAHVQLGLLLERIGHASEAAHHYRRALDLTTQTGAEGVAERAQLMEHLADAFRQAGDAPQAARLYRQALGLWQELLEQVRGPRRAVVEVRRGVLHSRLGDREAAEAAFANAMEAAPSWREPYAAILAHLMVGSPNAELAHEVLRRATYQITLEPEWKVYFALWVQSIAARGEEQLEDEVRLLLGDMAEGEGWSAQLASFGRGELTYRQLLEATTSRGQRAEAAFYEGARRLGTGDVAGARQLFRAVVETGMVNFYEYAMAQELLNELGDDVRAIAEQ